MWLIWMKQGWKWKTATINMANVWNFIAWTVMELIIETKNNLLLAIVGDDAIETNSWIEIWEEGTMKFFRFCNFVCRVIISLGNDHLGCSFCFIMDNLNNHHNFAVLQMIHDAGHWYVFPVPYWSCNGDIEYVFNTIHGFLLYDYPGCGFRKCNLKYYTN